MLEQFVESENNVKSGARRGKFLITTSMLVAVIFLNGILWSLFARDLGMGNDSLDLSTVVAPVAVTEDVPAPPEPIKKTDKSEEIQKSDTVPTRQANIARVDEPQIAPDTVATTSNNQKSRPAGTFKISSGPETDNYGSPNGTTRGSSTSEGVKSIVPTQIQENTTIEEPPVKKQIVTEPAPKPVIRQVSKGVINGSALVLPKPNYPPAAKAVHATGEVSVQVTIDESGKVISANAVSGHPLLKQVSEAAARGATFKPTLLSNQPVKVTGVIVYKFMAQ